MVESVFQTLLLLAYFDIALLSVSVASYAVSVAFLGTESRLFVRRMEKRKQELLEKLRKLRGTNQISEARKEIGKVDWEQKVLSLRILLLSWKGAVLLPSVFLCVSFACSVFGINAETIWNALPEENLNWFIGSSVFFTGLGFLVLLAVVVVIDSVARKLPIPEFEVWFEKRGELAKYGRNKSVKMMLCVYNKGEDIADDVLVVVNFPPSFKINEAGADTSSYTISKQSPESDYPGYYAAVLRLREPIHIEVIVSSYIDVTTPDEKKIFEIPVIIYERKTKITKYKPTIEVTE